MRTSASPGASVGHPHHEGAKATGALLAGPDVRSRKVDFGDGDYEEIERRRYHQRKPGGARMAPGCGDRGDTAHRHPSLPGLAATFRDFRKPIRQPAHLNFLVVSGLISLPESTLRMIY